MIILKVREIAEGKGMDMQRLATESGISQSTIVNLWHNCARRIDRRTLDRLCLALQVDPGDLLVREETTETRPQSALDILKAHHRFLEENPEQRLFFNVAAVDEYIKQERDVWDN